MATNDQRWSCYISKYLYFHELFRNRKKSMCHAFRFFVTVPFVCAVTNFDVLASIFQSLRPSCGQFSADFQGIINSNTRNDVISTKVDFVHEF